MEGARSVLPKFCIIPWPWVTRERLLLSIKFAILYSIIIFRILTRISTKNSNICCLFFVSSSLIALERLPQNDRPPPRCQLFEPYHFELSTSHDRIVRCLTDYTIEEITCLDPCKRTIDPPTKGNWTGVSEVKLGGDGNWSASIWDELGIQSVPAPHSLLAIYAHISVYSASFFWIQL